MTSVWQRFDDPTWRQAAEQRQHKDIGGSWQVAKTDNKKTKQHKLRVKDWLFKNNLTEELLLNHPSPDDVKLFQDIRLSCVYDYFDPSDIAQLGALEERVIIRRQSLTKIHLEKINNSVKRAQRLYLRGIRRLGILNGREEYVKYKEQVKKVYLETK